MAYRTGFASGYLDPVVVRQRFEALPGLFPGLCRLETLPHRTHGYRGVRSDLSGPQTMHVLHVTSPAGPAVKPAILLMRSHHAREWINAIAVVEAACRLLENYWPGDPDPRVQTLVRLLDRVAFMILPEGNPDGALYSFFDPGRRMWRKNLRPGTGGCQGVDCNRNYPTFFGDPGSSADPCTEIYHGPSPLSEPETANIADLVERNRNILFAIDSHSSGQAIFRPQAAGGTHVASLPIGAADDLIYRNLEEAMNARIAAVAGTTYSTGSTSNHAGTSDEYLFFAQSVFGFDLECGMDFQPPVAEALVAADEVVEALIALGLCAAGDTGLDVEALMERRLALPAQPPLAPDVVAPTGDSVADAPLPPEKWRRLLVAILPSAPDKVVAEGLELMAQGYDVDEDLRDGIAAVVSEEELDALVTGGWRVTVERDVERDGPAPE